MNLAAYAIQALALIMLCGLIGYVTVLAVRHALPADEERQR